MICQNNGIMKKKWKVKIIIYNIYLYILYIIKYIYIYLASPLSAEWGMRNGNLLIVICQV